MLSLVLKAEGKILKHYCLLIPYMDAVLKANFPLTPVEVQAKIWMLQPIYRFLVIVMLPSSSMLAFSFNTADQDEDQYTVISLTLLICLIVMLQFHQGHFIYFRKRLLRIFRN